jgi:hypothetical protein
MKRYILHSLHERANLISFGVLGPSSAILEDLIPQNIKKIA